jgi:hypothetical protein
MALAPSRSRKNLENRWLRRCLSQYPQYSQCSAQRLLLAAILDACRRVIEENWPRGQLTERNPLILAARRRVLQANWRIAISATYPESPDGERRGSASSEMAACSFVAIGHVT